MNPLRLSSPVILTLGNFDGVHLGHRQILDLVVGKARSQGGSAVAMTFRPHPQLALRPGTQLPLLSTYEERARLIRSSGVDALIEEPFSRELSNTPPREFFNEIVLRRLSARELVVGYDFAFGRGREGSLEVMQELCDAAGVTLTIVPPFKVEGEVASSSRIRALLLGGHVEEATRLLGHEFFYQGVIERGEQRGRKLGFPTANLRPRDGKLVLPYGVYATWAVLEDGQRLPSVTNLGVRPTFIAQAAEGEEQVPVISETHILDQKIDLYGRTLEVRFVARLREERKFSGLEALRTQIQTDVQEARKALGIG